MEKRWIQHGLPEPDLLIRTCNEQRISNFLLWQLAYTEFYFTPVPWPDFSKEELIRRLWKHIIIETEDSDWIKEE